MVDVFIGLKRKKFHLHKALLCDRSDYFKTGFLGNSAQVSSKELFLPAADGAAFEMFVNWLHGQPRAALTPPTNTDEIMVYLQLLALSEKFLIEYLQNFIVDLIRAYYRNVENELDIKVVSCANQNLSEGGIQRFLSLHAAQQTLLAHKYGGIPHVLSPDLQRVLKVGGPFADRFALCLVPWRGWDAATKMAHCLLVDRDCIYHRHESTPECVPVDRDEDDLEYLKLHIVAKYQKLKDRIISVSEGVESSHESSEQRKVRRFRLSLIRTRGRRRSYDLE